jgi:hypothetical protein
MKYRARSDYRLPPRSVAAVTSIQFTFGWSYTLFASARVQKEYRDDKGKKPKALFSIHHRRQYCAQDRLNKIFQCGVLISGGTRFLVDFANPVWPSVGSFSRSRDG